MSRQTTEPITVLIDWRDSASGVTDTSEFLFFVGISLKLSKKRQRISHRRINNSVMTVASLSQLMRSLLKAARCTPAF